MNTQMVMRAVAVTMLAGGPAFAQGPAARMPALAPQYTDPATGLSLDSAIARARDQEPSLGAARTTVDAARGMRLQAGLRPNPTVSFERRQEPGGTDNYTMAGVEWPLDLFRRSGRLAVAERALEAAGYAVANRERLLIAEVRTWYGEVLAAVRDLAILDDLVAAARRQLELLRSRVQEGASPPLERDLLDVELRRLESDRLLQAGRADAALFELKRVLGMTAATPLTVSETLEGVVRRELTAATAADVPAALERRPDVREAEARVGVAEAKIDRSQRDGRFDVSLVGTYMRMDTGFPQLGFAGDGNLERVRGVFHYVAAGAKVTVPLFNRNEGEVAVARAERAGAEASRDAAHLAVENEIAGARARDERARQAVLLYSTGAQALARQNLTVVTETYELGRVTVFDVLTERRRFLDVERAYTEALRAAFEARTALKRALDIF